MRIILIILYSYCAVFSFFAQNQRESAEGVINDLFEQYSAESNSVIDYESFYNDLIGFLDVPLNLNTATLDNLQQMVFLNAIQIENILAYRYKQGEFSSLYELQLIDGLDMTDIRRMLPFVTVGGAVKKQNRYYFRDFINQGRSELFYRLDYSPEQKAGYKIEDANKSFAGSRFYNSLKYKYQFRNRLFAGIAMEKDAGEQFWGNLNKGYDFYSFHLQATQIGIFKNVVVGDFRASFGQGLVMKSSFGSSKSSYVTHVMNTANGLQKYSSTNEQDYLRGVGTTLQVGKAEFTAFYAYKKIDADTVGGFISTLTSTGLHRSINELKRKHTASMQTAGANLHLKFDAFRAGISVLDTRLSHPLIAALKPYNVHAFRGEKQRTIGLDYRWRLNIFQFFGESALTNKLAWATIHGVQFSPLSTIQLVALYRYYTPQYDTFYAGAFSESTHSNNETGIYVGASVNPFRKWKFSVYADSYRFPWLKYGIDVPSIGRDYLLQADYNYSRYLQMKWRVKYEEKMKNAGTGTLQLSYPYSKMSARYRLNFTAENFSYQSQIELSFSDSTSSRVKWGFAVSQDLSYAFSHIPLSVNLRCMYFDAKDYDNRFYFYERDVLYAFSIPMFYGTGFRYFLNFRYDVSERISGWIKIAQTAFDPEIKQISSGVDQIQGNKRTDIRCLVRYKF